MIDADVSAQLEVAPPRGPAHRHASHAHHDTAEDAGSGRPIRGKRKRSVVTALALTPMRRINPKGSAGDQGEIQTGLELVVVVESPSQANSEDFVVIGLDFVVV